MVSGTQVLDNTRINGVMQGLLDPRTLPAQLIFSQRVRERPAEDGEIMARFVGHIHIADLIADDQRAGVYSTGKMQYEQVNIPNLKVGTNMTQAMLNQWLAINNNPAVPQYLKDMFSGNQTQQLLNLRVGVAQRKESLIVGMMMDSFSYDRLGIKMSGVTWGMYSDLKVTVSTAWTDASNATPIADIQNVQYTAKVRYGKTYNRVTMSTPAFRLMIATTEFQNKSRMYLAPNVSFVNLNQTDLAGMTSLAEAVLKMTIVLSDARYWSQKANGLWVQAPFLDLNAVILDDSNDDNDVTVQDFANGIVTESLVSSLTNDGVVPGGPQFGPVAYAIPNWTYNAPEITYWAVQRGFPRKHNLAANACLRIGTVTETISTADPF